MAEKPLRVVLLGKTGAGKNKFGNVLIGEEIFEVDRSPDSGTSQCKAVTGVNGQITVIDAPGFFDNITNAERQRYETIKTTTECSPGPHALLVFLKVEKYTEHEKQVMIKIKKLFSEDAFEYAVLVFTHGDQLAEGRKIKEFVSENKDLKELSDKCGGRCHVVDNKYWNNNQQDPYRDNQFQIRQLLSTINGLVQQHGGGCYTNKMLQEVERKIQEETTRTGSREEAKKNVTDFFFKKLADIDPGELLGALLGSLEDVKKVHSAVFGLPGVATWTAVGAAAGAVIGAIGGPVGAAAGAAAGAVGGTLGGLMAGLWGKPKTE
ncbi:GTPase IMAP family member 4-like [Salarias fasciatus]|uniref:GTPase IMAP family member 4-like n=1 Tax=Salarias fasciatus TaxID=181472 RepID=UPI00117654B8|nr:GTPase IMAP family member 4-like [Salarias fasciatus]